MEVADGRVKVYVTAPPADGEANEQTIRVLAKALGVPKTSLSIVRGHRSREKVVDIGGLTTRQAMRILS